MTSREELEKLTVAQLKEQLKGRKLTISGTKSELINRLHESIVTEERLLESSGAEFDISNVNVDEVLGLDLDHHNLTSPQHQQKEFKLPSENTISTNIGCETDGNSHQQITKPAPIPINDQEDQSKNFAISLKSAEIANNGNQHEKGTSKVEQNEEKVVQIKMAAKLGLPIAEAKAKRAARFGTSDSADGDRIKKRAERFGGLSAGPPVKGDVEQEDAKLKRAARFGVSIDDDMRAKRAKRFGITDADSDEKSTLNTLYSDSEKLAQRSKRFAS